MEKLTRNLEAVLARKGRDIRTFLDEFAINELKDLTVEQLEDFCRKEGINLYDMLAVSLSIDTTKFKKIKLLILDVDGVMTDGGMYFTENGDQFKKYNAKDGMAILNLQKLGVKAGIISSGFKSEMIKSRANLLQIERFYVGRDPKIDILKQWCDEMKIDFSQVAMIGDDINDLSVIREVGFSACPADAVRRVKEEVDLVLNTKGGRGCVRELIDDYFLDEPMNK